MYIMYVCMCVCIGAFEPLKHCKINLCKNPDVILKPYMNGISFPNYV